MQVAKRADPDDIVVVLNPDSGRGYLSRIFDDDWMANFGFVQECDQCIGAVLDTRGNTPSLLYVNPSDTVRRTIEAAIRQGWDMLLRPDVPFIGMLGFGASAPAKDLYAHFGITAEAAANAALTRLGRK